MNHDLQGEIKPGQEFVWEPIVPEARERCRVTRVIDRGSVHQNTIFSVCPEDSNPVECHNDESRFREACIRITGVGPL